MSKLLNFPLHIKIYCNWVHLWFLWRSGSRLELWLLPAAIKAHRHDPHCKQELVRTSRCSKVGCFSAPGCSPAPWLWTILPIRGCHFYTAPPSFQTETQWCFFLLFFFFFFPQIFTQVNNLVCLLCSLQITNFFFKYWYFSLSLWLYHLFFNHSRFMTSCESTMSVFEPRNKKYILI